MQDYMGVRFDLDCFHSELIEIGECVSILLEKVEVEVRIEQILEEPHNGYRAVHLHIISENAGRVEVQLRTLLQTAWANAYEKAGDIVGRSIRYDDEFVVEDPKIRQVVEELLQLSSGIYAVESQTWQTASNQKIATSTLASTLERRFEALPRATKYYESISKAFHALGRAYGEMAKQADANSNLLHSLQQLEDSLALYASEAQRK